MTLSPAERYAAAKKRSELAKGVLGGFRAGLSFELDPFQLEGCRAIQDGHGVLVAAPTSAGKTVVGQFAAYVALSQQSRCFYTTPIKALSNQKFAEFCQTFGADHVGLLTGDNAINGDAPVVVMTTEVLRNMLYEGSSALGDLSHVVMDEVHYLADRSRGAVWEEVIIHLPAHVDVVALSATVSNAEEFGDWLRTVRGDTEVVVEEHRPTPLHQHVIAQRSLHDLFTDPRLLKVNPDLGRLAYNDRSNPRGRFASRYTPSRATVVETLDREAMLPCIYFIFSRAACDDAVQQVLAAGTRLTTSEEALQIRGIVDARFSDTDAAELRVLGFATWLEALENGVAAHHAGMIPAFKEVVEQLFQAGLVKVVFATETLALGINMPARSVVLEKLTKWNGSVHAPITPGEYTQLTGRAGRRGIDSQGHAVVVWHHGIDPQALAGLASTRTYPLRSSFRPSYNMAVNLIDKVGFHTARELLESSFAQFQADRAVVGLATELRRNEEAVHGYDEAGTCHLGDFADYMRIRRELSAMEKDQVRDGVRERRFSAVNFLNGLERGDVFLVEGQRRASVPYVVLDPPQDAVDPRPRVMSMNGIVKRVGYTDVGDDAVLAGRITLPPTFDSRSAKSRHWLGQQLSNRVASAPRRERAKQLGPSDAEVSRLRKALRAHPCHGCNDREEHARWHERSASARRDIAKLESRVESRTSSIAREFDRICDVLHRLGYLKQEGEGYLVTPAGRMLGRLYCERDLLAAECLRRGLWAGLAPDQLAAVISTLVFESRRDDADEQVSVPDGAVGDALAAMATAWGEIRDIEEQCRADRTGDMDAGFVWPALRWARGQAMSKVLQNNDVSPGDFVRWAKQVIDLASQVALAADDDDVSRAARSAAGAMDRGIVAW